MKGEPIFVFVEEYCQKAPEASIDEDELYDAYRVFCIAHQRHAVSRDLFFRVLTGSKLRLHREGGRILGLEIHPAFEAWIASFAYPDCEEESAEEDSGLYE